jgi:predicted membrane channel-forming protein YqfA (hemolysin III family)
MQIYGLLLILVFSSALDNFPEVHEAVRTVFNIHTVALVTAFFLSATYKLFNKK